MRRLVPALVSAVLLLMLTLAIEPHKVTMVLGQLPVWSLVAALMISIPQVVLSALRWRYTAQRLNVSLGVRESILAYYRATLVNQLMPGGVLGDVQRAWHTRDPRARTSAAVHSVMIERLSGQIALLLIIAALLTLAPPVAPVGAPTGKWLLGVLGVALLVAVLRLPFLRHYTAVLGADCRAALLRWPAPVIQFALSTAAVASYFATLALLDIGLTGQPIGVEKLALHGCLLLSMVVPVSVAGWGVREGVAAILWPMAGFPASEGVALGIAYGLVILMGSLPGLIPGLDQESQNH